MDSFVNESSNEQEGRQNNEYQNEEIRFLIPSHRDQCNIENDRADDGDEIKEIVRAIEDPQEENGEDRHQSEGSKTFKNVEEDMQFEEGTIHHRNRHREGHQISKGQPVERFVTTLPDVEDDLKQDPED